MSEAWYSMYSNGLKSMSIVDVSRLSGKRML